MYTENSYLLKIKDKEDTMPRIITSILFKIIVLLVSTMPILILAQSVSSTSSALTSNITDEGAAALSGARISVKKFGYKTKRLLAKFQQPFLFGRFTSPSRATLL